MQNFNADNQRSATGYSFDGNGNPTTYQGNTLGFDAENRLTTFGSALTNTFTAEGLRAKKSSSAGTFYYLYDGATPICELGSNGGVNNYMTFGPAGLLSRHWVNSVSLFWAFDPQGNPSQKLNSDGTLYQSFLFSAQGARAGSSGEAYSHFGAQAGGFYDSEPRMSDKSGTGPMLLQKSGPSALSMPRDELLAAILMA